MSLNQKMTLRNIGRFPQKYNSVVYIKRPIDSKEILYIFKGILLIKKNEIQSLMK